MGDLERTYYNATIICDKTNVNDFDYQALFEDTTAQNIVSRTGGYEFAIERFSMEGQNIPIWIPNISSGNTTTYSITLSASFPAGGGKTFTGGETFLQFIPRNGKEPNDPAYYFVYHYDNFCEMMNNAFASALTSLQQATANYTIKTTAPIIVYDGVSNLFSIYCDAQGFVSNTAGEVLSITFNNDLYNLLKTFYFNTNNNNYKTLIIQNKLTNFVSNVNNSGLSYWIATQMQPSTASCWSPVQSILFTSDSICLKPEIIGNVSVVGTGLSLGSGNSNNVQTQITDLVLDLSRSSDYLDMVTYQPTLHRWIDLSDSQNLKNFRFSVWWLNKYNQQRYPLLLSNNGCLTMKVLYQKKL